MKTSLTNPTLHMNKQIFSLFVAMSKTKVNLNDRIWMDTKPYCNCREQGFVVSLRLLSTIINYAFYEHRNTDDICCIKWEGQINIAGACTPKDIPEEVFKTKSDYTKSWKYDSISEVVSWFKEEVQKCSIELMEKYEAKYSSSSR